MCSLRALLQGNVCPNAGGERQLCAATWNCAAGMAQLRGTKPHRQEKNTSAIPQYWKYPLERGKLSQHLIVKPEVLHTLFLEYIQPLCECLQIHSNLPNEAHLTREEVTCSCGKARFRFLYNLH